MIKKKSILYLDHNHINQHYKILILLVKKDSNYFYNDKLRYMICVSVFFIYML